MEVSIASRAPVPSCKRPRRASAGELPDCRGAGWRGLWPSWRPRAPVRREKALIAGDDVDVSRKLLQNLRSWRRNRSSRGVLDLWGSEPAPDLRAASRRRPQASLENRHHAERFSENLFFCASKSALLRASKLSHEHTPSVNAKKYPSIRLARISAPSI